MLLGKGGFWSRLETFSYITCSGGKGGVEKG